MNINTYPAPGALTPEQLREQSQALAQEIVDKVMAAQPEPLTIGVALEALITLYRSYVMQLSPDGVGHCAMVLGSLAGALLQASAAPAPNAPSSTSTH